MTAPRQWREVQLGEVVTPRRQKAAPETLNGVPFVGLEHVEAHTGRILGIGEAVEMKSAVAVFQSGDVLYSRLRPYLNKVVHPDFSGAASAEFIVLPGNETIDASFLRWLLLQQAFVQFASHINQGDRPRVDFGQIAHFRFQLPKVDEQRRIVAKLDSLFARSRAAREELARVPRLVERYKQAVLEEAFRFAEEAASNNFSLGDLAVEVRNGLSRKPAQTPPGIPILRISAVRPGRVNLSESRFYVPDAGEKIDSFALAQNDLLFTRYNGNAEFVAVGGLVRGLTSTVLYPDKLIRVRLDQTIVKPEFVELLMQSRQVRKLLSQYIKTAAGQHGISGKDLKSTSLPVPPLDKQSKIVSEATASLNSVNMKRREVEKATNLLDRLDQATLAKAFRGELSL